MTRPAYRLRMYAPRSVDPTETQLLTPRAGADHTDAFQVATEQGIAGYQPYLTEVPTGKRSAIDALSKQTDIGAMTFHIGDRKLGTGNASRWVTSFLGDANGEDVFKGRRIEVDESLDFDPVNPAAATWVRWYTGRVISPALDGRLAFAFAAHEVTEDLEVDVFVGAPSTTVAGVSAYAQQTQLYPLGLIQKYGPFPLQFMRVQATIFSSDANGFVARVNHSGAQVPPRSMTIVKAFGDLLDDPFGSLQTKAHVVMTRLDTLATSEWLCVGAERGTSIGGIFGAPIAGVSPAPPPVGTPVDFWVKPIGMPVTDSLPLLIDDVHPITLMRHLLLGAFGRLNVDGSPTWAMKPEPTSFAALEADPSFGTWRSIERAPMKLNDAIERICRERHVAYYPNAKGEIVVVDLRRTATLVPAAALTGADLVTDEVPTWVPDATQAVPSVTVTYYQEQWIADDELPNPFDVIPLQGYPDIAPCRIDDSVDHVIRVEQFGPRTGDVKGSGQSIEARGMRFAIGALEDYTLSVLPVIEKQNGQSRAALIEAALTAVASDMRGPYALGPTTGTLEFKRSAASGIWPGAWVTVTVDEWPDAASNRRGGTRLCLVLARIENGPSIALELLDAGANAVAVVPTLGVLAAVATDANALSVPVTRNAAGDAVRLQAATTTTAVGVAPATGWVDVSRVTADGTVTIRGLGRDTRRVWLRARSEPQGGQGYKLPSAWASPSGAAFLDLAALPAPTGLTVVDVNGVAILTWTPGATTLAEEIFLTTGGVPGAWTDAMRVVRLDAGSVTWRVGPLTLGQTYSVGVCTIDATGARSTFATATFVCLSSATLDPPTDPIGFAGSHSASGMSILDGTYGLAVAAVQFPGEVEFAEQVESPAASGLFGALTSVGKIGAVQGDWTRIERTAPNDNCKRRLVARSVKGTAVSAWTDGVDVLPWTPLELPLFARTVGSTELTNLVKTESTTTVDWAWTRGSRVAFVWLFDRLLQAPIGANPWPSVSDLPDATLATGVDHYTASKPKAGFQRLLYLVPFFKSGAGYKRGTPIKLEINPAPAALAAKMKATVTNDLADLSVEATIGEADAPARADVYADNPDAAPIATFTATTSRTFTKLDDPALGGLTLPLRELRHFWTKLTNAAGVSVWTHTSADRDPLPNATVSTRDFRANAQLVVDVDDDTDQVRITLPNGKTITFSGLTGNVTVTYTIGDALDDATFESLLNVDETRGNYLVEAHGGGTWLPMWRGDMHGKPGKPPTIAERVVLNGNRDAADVYLVPQSQTTEQVRLFVKDSESAGAPVYGLCASAADPSPLYVTSGTEVGPSNFFTAGGSPSAKLSGITLGRDRIVPIYVQAVGEQSGIAGDWKRIELSLMEKPYVESLTLAWDEVAQVLRFRAKAGPHAASCYVELDDNAGFVSPLTYNGNVSEGGEFTGTAVLSGANRGVVWYARATMFNGPGLTGLASTMVIEACPVPSLVDVDGPYPTENAGVGTYTFTVTDKGAFVDPAAKVSFYVQVNGVRTAAAATTQPAGTTTTGTYTKTVTLDEKHPTIVEAYVNLIDGTQMTVGAVTFDADKVANVVNLDVSYGGVGVATVVVTFDSDTATGPGGGQYSVDNGTSWTDMTVGAARTAVIAFFQQSTGSFNFLVRGKASYDGSYGPPVTGLIDAFAAAPGTAAIAFDVIPGNESSQASAGFTAALPVNAGSARYILSVVSDQTDATVTSFGTVINGRTLSVTNVATVSLGTKVWLTIVPYSGAGATGTALPSIHVSATYQQFGQLKTLTLDRSLWRETTQAGIGYGLFWSGADAANPAFTGPGSYDMFVAISTVLAAGVKVRSVFVPIVYNFAAQQLNFVNARLFLNGVQQGATQTVSPIGSQTIGFFLPDVVVAGSLRIEFEWGSPGSAADAAQIVLRDPSITYVSPSQEKGV